MTGNTDVIELLNQILTNELTAINQYFVHSKMCQDWGYKALASHMRAESIDEMRHAELIIDRILFLEGVPNLARLGSVCVGQDVPEQFKVDLALEHNAIQCLAKTIELCRSVGDTGSYEIVKGILVSEEEHVSWLEEQLSLVENIGLQNYLAQQLA